MSERDDLARLIYGKTLPTSLDPDLFPWDRVKDVPSGRRYWAAADEVLAAGYRRDTERVLTDEEAAQELTAVTYRDRSQTDETIRVLAEQGIRLVRVEPEP